MRIQSPVQAGTYPPQAFQFVHEGLDHTVVLVHGPLPPRHSKENRHVSGRQLCEGLRELALARWGPLATVVLHQWNIHATIDFGKIVFSLIEGGQMQKIEEDTIEDFRNVFDFKTAFEAEYRIPCHAVQS